MKYQDPFQITCPACRATGSHSVRSLLALQARCTGCGVALETVGREMNAQRVQWSTFFGKVEIAMLLEKKFGVSISDQELDAANTGMDLVELIRAKLALTTSKASDAPEIVRAAITTVRQSEISLDEMHVQLANLLADLTFEG